MDNPISYLVLLLIVTALCVRVLRKLEKEMKQRRLESELAWEELEAQNRRLRFVEEHGSYVYDEEKEVLPF